MSTTDGLGQEVIDAGTTVADKAGEAYNAVTEDIGNAYDAVTGQVNSLVNKEIAIAGFSVTVGGLVLVGGLGLAAYVLTSSEGNKTLRQLTTFKWG